MMFKLKDSMIIRNGVVVGFIKSMKAVQPVDEFPLVQMEIRIIRPLEEAIEWVKEITGGSKP